MAENAIMEQYAGKSEEELKAIFEAQAKKGEELQKQENSEDPVKADYITLAKPLSKALDSTNKELFIEGLAVNDFYNQNLKVNLGKQLKVVPLKFLTIYNEMEDKPANQNPKFYGVWNQEQAKRNEVDAKDFWKLRLPNGHVLIPVNWVMVEILGHPELTRAVIAYKSTGNRIWRKWKEDVKSRGGSCASLVYTVQAALCENDKNQKWTDIGFEFTGLLYEMPGQMAMACHCMAKSNEIKESYTNGTLVPDRKLEEKPRVTAISDTTMAAQSIPKIDVAEVEGTSFDDMEAVSKF